MKVCVIVFHVYGIPIKGENLSNIIIFLFVKNLLFFIL